MTKTEIIARLNDLLTDELVESDTVMVPDIIQALTPLIEELADPDILCDKSPTGKHCQCWIEDTKACCYCVQSRKEPEPKVWR